MVEIPKRFNYLEINDQMKQALEAVYERENNVLILGAGGTGKSELIHIMKAIDIEKGINSALIAPTGIAAVNIGGSTIHSLFKLGIDFKNPEDVYLTPEVRDIINHIDHLIIDEISMVRADLFEIINKLCQKARMNNQFMGGILTVCIGDFFQLAPIMPRDGEALKLYTELYGDNPYFFGSEAYLANPHTFERVLFTKIYRTKDNKFKEILNRIRTGDQTDVDLEILNSKRMSYRKFKQEFGDEVYIAPFNKIVSEVNEEKLDVVSGEYEYFNAQISGYVNPKNFRAPQRLKLKLGAKVMLLVNNPEEGYHNGTLGHLDSILSRDSIIVDIGDKKVKVGLYEFSETKYVVKNGKLSTVKKGSFKQLPIVLGYAFTIHKTQSVTFDAGYVDFGYSLGFTEHLAYVALSRFSTFDNLRLKRSIHHEDIIVSPVVAEFMGTFDEEYEVVKPEVLEALVTSSSYDEDDMPF